MKQFQGSVVFLLGGGGGQNVEKRWAGGGGHRDWDAWQLTTI